MAHIDAGEILPNGHVQQMAADGRVTQMHRGNQYADEGDTFEIDGTEFEVTDVTHRTLGDMTDADAKREGSEDLDAYKQRMKQVHGSFEWDDDSGVVRHRFEPADA